MRPKVQRIRMEQPHPLASALLEFLGAHSHARLLELGSGGGRNSDALRAAGLEVASIPDSSLLPPPSLDEQAFDGALSTHGFLHGTPDGIAALVAQTARALKHGGPLFATFASTRDARFGEGRRIEENTYAPASGEERGVPHVYYDRASLTLLLERYFSIDALEEVDADTLVGRWAHAKAPAGTVHWFARLRKRD